MASYDYRCDKCNETFEFQHSMEDTMDYAHCPNEDSGCVGYLHRVFTPAAVSFKGQGWGKVYRTHTPKKID